MSHECTVCGNLFKAESLQFQPGFRLSMEKKCLKKCHCWTSDTTYNVRGQKQDWLVCSLNHHMIIREVCNNTPLSMLPLHGQRSKNLTPLKAKMTKFTILQCTMCESMKCLFHTLKKITLTVCCQISLP